VLFLTRGWANLDCVRLPHPLSHTHPGGFCWADDGCECDAEQGANPIK
jgi:hypothetical protein